MSYRRRRHLFQGNVQGVGFRMTTRRLAQAYPLSGYVRNLPDGRVEVVSEGEDESIAAFLGAIRREFDGYIGRVDEETISDDTPRCESFEIRF